MRAATVVDGAVVVREHPDPQPGTGELLVRVRAAGLNGADLLQRMGLYPPPPGSPPDIPGLELAGEVAAIGPGVTRFAVGDRVMAVVGGGGQAELALVHERAAMPVPDGIDWPEAGGFPEVFTTAHDASVLPVRARRWASACSCTAPRAASAPPASSSAWRPGREVTASVRERIAPRRRRRLRRHASSAPTSGAGARAL